LPDKNRTNPVEVVLAAVEMQHYMKSAMHSVEGADKEEENPQGSVCQLTFFEITPVAPGDNRGLNSSPVLLSFPLLFSEWGEGGSPTL